MAQLLTSVLGHAQEIGRLTHAMNSGRLAHALLFCGPQGIGKRKIALGITQALVCENPENNSACGVCGACQRIEKSEGPSKSESLLLISPAGPQIRIEDSRSVTEFLRLKKWGRHRVILIDDAHLLNSSASNALLKVIEDPPPDTFFFLISPTPFLVLPTIRSRCQIVRFSPLTPSTLSKILGEPAANTAGLEELCDGRADLLKKFQSEEFQEVLSGALCLLQFSHEKRIMDAFSQARKTLESREKAQDVASLWARTFCFAAKRQIKNSQAAWPSALSQVQFLFGYATEHLLALAQEAQNLEFQISENLDKNLIFENFMLSLQQRSPYVV